jgi:sulfur relay (sulfurtransferase) DsrF/TusC family protein
MAQLRGLRQYGEGMMNKIAIILRKPPYGDINAAEALRHGVIIMMMNKINVFDYLSITISS